LVGKRGMTDSDIHDYLQTSFADLANDLRSIREQLANLTRTE
jgi:hypothetical protein